MKHAFLVILILTQVSISYAAKLENIDLLWKARALQASEKIAKFQKEIEGNKESIKTEKEDLKQKLELMLEQAFALIIISPETVIKNTSNGVYYHIFLNFGDDGYLDMVYGYNKNTGKPSGVRIDSLPKSHAVIYSSEGDYCDYIVLAFKDNPSHGMLFFSKSNPFAPKVVSLP